jgi:hypothetical protein
MGRFILSVEIILTGFKKCWFLTHFNEFIMGEKKQRRIFLKEDRKVEA